MTTKSNDQHPPTIAATPQFEEMAIGTKIVKTLAKWTPRVRPLLKLMGVDLPTFENALTKATAAMRDLEPFLEVPDRFNKLYASRGWMATSVMSMKAMTEAVALGERGEIDNGEALLVEQFTAEQLDFHLTRLGTVADFADRGELGRLAKFDFLEGRYHACVPNLLMLIDGLATDASGSNNESFFSERADLSAWNLMEGHPTGLPAVSRLMQTRRMKRRTEPLTIPFRHGILHGRDLGFANKLVAAKCWSVLIAVGEWARAVDAGKRSAPAQPRRSLMDSLRQLAELARRSERMKAWRPRDLVPGRNLPVSGPPSAYVEGSPERVLATYLDLWQRRNFGEMAKLVAIGIDKVDPRVRARDINRGYRGCRLVAYEFTALEERPKVAHVTVTCRFEAHDPASFKFFLVCENEEGDYTDGDLDRGSWRIMNWPVVPQHFLFDVTENDE